MPSIYDSESEGKLEAQPVLRRNDGEMQRNSERGTGQYK